MFLHWQDLVNQFFKGSFFLALVVVGSTFNYTHLATSLPFLFQAALLWLQSRVITVSLTLSGANKNSLKVKLERSHIPSSLLRPLQLRQHSTFIRSAVNQRLAEAAAFSFTEMQHCCSDSCAESVQRFVTEDREQYHHINDLLILWLQFRALHFSPASLSGVILDRAYQSQQSWRSELSSGSSMSLLETSSSNLTACSLCLTWRPC